LSTTIYPKSRIVNPSLLKSPYKTFTYVENGKPADHVDILILGDGYTAGEMEKFHKDVTTLTNELFNVEPFKSRKSDFNVRAVETPSASSGVNKPHPGVFNRTPLSMSYGAFDSERYALTYDNRTVRDVAATVPYDYMYILINERTYGGGGIYNLYSTVAADNKFSPYIFVHEFGHSFAALADEYYTSESRFQKTNWYPSSTVDLILIGPGVSFYKIKAEFNTSLSADDESLFFDRLNELLEDKFPGYNQIITGSGFKETGTMRSTTFGFRYMIMVGFRF